VKTTTTAAVDRIASKQKSLWWIWKESFRLYAFVEKRLLQNQNVNGQGSRTRRMLSLCFSSILGRYSTGTFCWCCA
jgi:hypothetical protein